MRKLIISVIFCLTFAGSAFAQRTSAGTFFLGAKGGTSFSSWGVEVEAGLYNMKGYWYADLSFMDIRLVSQKGSAYTYDPLSFNAGYMARIFGSLTRTLNVYGGGGIILGSELVDPFHKLPADEPAAISSRFLYGIRPTVSGEWFFYRNMALTLGLELPIAFNSQVKVVTCNALLGFRFNL